MAACTSPDNVCFSGCLNWHTQGHPGPTGNGRCRYNARYPLLGHVLPGSADNWQCVGGQTRWLLIAARSARMLIHIWLTYLLHPTPCRFTPCAHIPGVWEVIKLASHDDLMTAFAFPPTYRITATVVV